MNFKMQNILTRHKTYWSNNQFTLSTLTSILFFVTGLIIHNIAGVYTTQKMSNSVTDLLLDFLPALDVNLIFIEGTILFWAGVTILLLNEPKRIPFVLKSLALFLLIRSFFIILTHLGPPPDVINISPNSIIDKFTFKGDFFFSGHTGASFLMSVVFWTHKYLRWIFLTASIIFATSVLLGHIHYSIDVFAAFFISFTIFHLSLKFFAKDYSLFLNGLK